MIDFFEQTFLFRNTNESTLHDILEKHNPVKKSFKRGDLVYPLPPHPSVGFILSGQCEVCRTRSDGGRIIINILKKYDSFGLLSVFSHDEFPTQIFAAKNTDVLFFDNDQILDIVNNYSQISTNIIVFMADRIDFLNKKINLFSGNSVESRLASFIISEATKSGKAEIDFNVLKTSQAINCGRASVYRALDILVEENFISYSNKKIKIINYTDLERITK